MNGEGAFRRNRDGLLMRLDLKLSQRVKNPRVYLRLIRLR